MTTCMPCVSISIHRSATREQYGIEVNIDYATDVALESGMSQGNDLEDWMCGVLCPQLVTCQTAAEHEERTGNHISANVDRILMNAKDIHDKSNP